MKKRALKSHAPIHKKAIEISKKELLTSIIWILVILLIFYFSIRLIGTDDLQDKVETAGIFGPLILIIVKASTIVFAPLGGLPIYIASGTLFGFLKGTLYVLIGDFIGFTIAFYISRTFGKKVAEYFLSKQGMEAVKDVILHVETKKGLIQSCFVFIGFPEALSYGAGLSRVHYLRFILTFMSIWIIPVSILVALGETITKNFSGFSLIIINIIVVLIMMAGIFWLYKQSRKNKNS